MEPALSRDQNAMVAMTGSTAKNPETLTLRSAMRQLRRSTSCRSRIGAACVRVATSFWTSLLSLATRALRVPREAVWLVSLGALVALGSLAPFHLATWAESREELGSALARLALQTPVAITLMERCIAFVPLGWLAARAADRMRFRSPSWTAWAVVVLFAGILELGQVPIADRHARLSDLLLAAAFAGLGIAAARLGQSRRWSAARLALSANVIATASVLALLWSAHTGAEPDGWDCRYPLLIGNEATFDRPWRGSVRGLAIYPERLTADQVSGLARTPFAAASGRELRRRLGALVLYDFGRGQGESFDNLGEGGPSPAVAAVGEDVRRGVDGGVRLTGGSLLTTGSTATAGWCQVVMARRAFTLELLAHSELAAQTGPARLMSQSIDPLHRNFMLGQEGQSLVLRVRTPNNGANGAGLEVYTGQAMAPGAWRHVAATVARGEASIFVDGSPAAGPFRYAERVAEGEGRSLRIAWLCLIILAAGGGAGGALAGSTIAGLLGSTVSSAVASFGAVALPVWFHHAVDWNVVAVAAFAPLLGIGLAGVARRIDAQTESFLVRRSSF